MATKQCPYCNSGIYLRPDGRLALHGVIRNGRGLDCKGGLLSAEELEMHEKTLFSETIDDLAEKMKSICEQIAALPLPDQVEALNRARAMLHEVSPFKQEPVDLVLWVEEDRVTPNTYNPNVVYRPELKLLKTSVETYGMTYPLAVHSGKQGYQADAGYVVVDGEHRYITITANKQISARQHGYVPVASLNTKTEEDRMAATVAFNRARGVHKLDSMTDIVLSMLRAGWTDDEIAQAMGMDADEILRMKQVSGIAEAYTRPNFNRAWINDNGQQTLD